ncbi:hypothetical protein BDK51DRAFT_43231 [Blyttiomyces helicus]|uniref:Uncharacterized protein n=1 Tax=Blyttiomyces helicus TaxID=388810 RepID=A0A4P9WIQ7_9FUNG|nr:hypothetical protein BDK51DRAFT_43231 [Blyttiomyces helicus]|eukprot:RKO91328.1 hypothetical protein BDK51DRAFT_43231 [Blyttiomyces helicus]
MTVEVVRKSIGTRQRVFESKTDPSPGPSAQVGNLDVTSEGRLAYRRTHRTATQLQRASVPTEGNGELPPWAFHSYLFRSIVAKYPMSSVFGSYPLRQCGEGSPTQQGVELKETSYQRSNSPIQNLTCTSVPVTLIPVPEATFSQIEALLTETAADVVPPINTREEGPLIIAPEVRDNKFGDWASTVGSV